MIELRAGESGDGVTGNPKMTIKAEMSCRMSR
jgi:hypothetical protein